MADPVTILCSILTIADASKKVLDVCTEYIAHARNAPKEFQRVVEDVHALNGTMKKLDKLAKSARRTRDNADQFDQWEFPLKRIKSDTEELVQIISQQDLKIGVFHELKFRARWPRYWGRIDGVLSDIRRLRSDLKLATSVYGAEMVGMVFEIVDERLPKVPTVEYYDSKRVHDASWNKVDDGDCSPDERPAFILQRLGDLLGWHLAMYEYPAFDNTHQDNVHRSVHYTKEAFLETKVYQAWKTRKIRGPGLLCVTGPPMTGKTTLCCRVIQDLQNSNDGDVGVAYYYFKAADDDRNMLVRAIKFWIIQLASQCESLPSELLPAVTNSCRLRDSQLPSPDNENRRRWETGLRQVLWSLLTRFRRTFIIIDGLTEMKYAKQVESMVLIIRALLEQDFGNVSIAIFSRSEISLVPLLELADVSVKVSQVEPDLSEYVRLKVTQTVKPLLNAGGLDYDDESLATIEGVINEASTGLYLGADVLVDSLITTIRDRGNVAAFLRQTREGNEIMLQRDPESMKQKAFAVETRNSPAGMAGPSKRAGL